jgi:hypothetical protein
VSIQANFDRLGQPLRSPFQLSVRLMPQFTDENALYCQVEERFGSFSAFLLKYYLYALNLRLRPELTFLAARPTPVLDIKLILERQV